MDAARRPAWLALSSQLQLEPVTPSSLPPFVISTPGGGDGYSSMLASARNMALLAALVAGGTTTLGLAQCQVRPQSPRVFHLVFLFRKNAKKKVYLVTLSQKYLHIKTK